MFDEYDWGIQMIRALLILLLICNIAFAWEGTETQTSQAVDIMPLDRGFYTSCATVTGSVSAVPLYGNYTDRRSMIITNSDDSYSVYITASPTTNPVDAGYEILARNSLFMDIGDSTTYSTVYIQTSDSTVSVSISTIEIR